MAKANHDIGFKTVPQKFFVMTVSTTVYIILSDKHSHKNWNEHNV